MKRLLSIVLAAGILTSCNNTATKETKAVQDSTAKDLHTQSNADVVKLKHLHLDIAVNFDTKKIAGSATWDIENPEKQQQLVLDAYQLTVDSIQVDGKTTSYVWGPSLPHVGSALKIPINPESKKVVIYYRTGDNPRALQW
jgi:leukotriene-A4 hydrolase